MGGAPCLIIIMDGNLAYATVAKFSEQYPNINIFKLEAAIEASCQSISFAGIYYHLDNDKYISSTYTQPIIDLHSRIINELPNVMKEPQDKANRLAGQDLVNELANKLIDATRKLQELFD